MKSNILMGLVIALGLLAAFLGWRLHSAQQTITKQASALETAKTDIQRAKETNTMNLQTIEDQRTALADCLANAAADREAAAEERRRREQLEQERAALARTLAEERKRDYETDPDYRAWADTDVPDSSARRVRDAAAAARADRDPDG